MVSPWVHCFPNQPQFKLLSHPHLEVCPCFSFHYLTLFYSLSALTAFTMKFSYPLLSSVLLVTTVVAAPHPKAGFSRRLERRARTLRDSTMRSDYSSNSKLKTQAATDSTSSIQYSENWSGLAYTSPPSGESFNAVSAKFTVPSPSVPSGVAATDGEYSASAWVGIDGNTYSTAILQLVLTLLSRQAERYRMMLGTNGTQIMPTILISQYQLAMSVFILTYSYC